MDDGDLRSQIRDFLSTRRARISPIEAGVSVYSGRRRVAGLRREEVAMLAGVSLDYYVRLERGNLSGASEAVLHALAGALRLDDAERAHLFDLARSSNRGAPQPRPVPRATTADAERVLGAITHTPAWVRNAYYDMLAANPLARALYAPLFTAARRPVNTARFLFLDPAAREFFVDHDSIADDITAVLRIEAGRDPANPRLVELLGELSASADFRRRWDAHEVRFHHGGVKTLDHPVIGRLELTFDALEFPASPGLTLVVYRAAEGTPAADGLAMLASWAATEHRYDLPVRT